MGFANVQLIRLLSWVGVCGEDDDYGLLPDKAFKTNY